MHSSHLTSDFFQYLVSLPESDGEPVRLPSLVELSEQLGVSVPRLREQLEVARAMGLVEVRPRTGIRRLPYSFYATISQSLNYALKLDRSYFDTFSELRNHLEAAYWQQAVRLLTSEDHAQLQQLLTRAWTKLRNTKIEIPHDEHRQLHMLIYSRIENPFVQGILEAYWVAYEAVGLNLYAGLEYLLEVWEYHQRMVDAICAGDFNLGYEVLIEHTDLLHQRPVSMMLGHVSEPE